MIEKAVIPAAGLGTRMLPLTKSIPKEMLPVGDKPMIQHCVEELYRSGIVKVCFIISHRKQAIKEYFLERYNYSRDARVDEVEKLATRLKLCFVYQEQPLGLGDALLAARDFVGDDTFVMVIPDQILYSEKPATLQLIEYYMSNKTAVWVGLLHPPASEAPYFTEHKGYRLGERCGNMCRIEELLPQIGELRGFGRVILHPDVFDFMERDPEYVNGFSQYIKNAPYYGVFLEGTPFDFGTLEGYYRYLPQIWSLMQSEDMKA